MGGITISKRRIAYQDLLNFASIGSPVASPDGRYAAYVKFTVDQKHNRENSNIWIYDHERDESYQLTSGDRDYNPRFSPDGKNLTFLSKRSEDSSKSAQLYLISLQGGEGKQLTDELDKPSDHSWSPCGRYIAVVAEKLYPDPDTGDLREKLAQFPSDSEDDIDEIRRGEGISYSYQISEKQPNWGLRVIDRMKYRFDGKGYMDDRYSQLYLLNFENLDKLDNLELNSTIKPVLLTQDRYDVETYSWHPKGDRITFTADMLEQGQDFWKRDIWEVKISQGHPHKVTKMMEFSSNIAGQAWSPKGDKLAFIGQVDPDTRVNSLWIYNESEVKCIDVTEQFDRSVGSQMASDVSKAIISYPPVWDNQGDYVFFPAVDQGNTQLYKAKLFENQQAQIQELFPNLQGNASTPVFGQDKLWFLYDDPSTPADLWKMPFNDGGSSHRCTQINRQLMESLKLGEYEHIRYTSEDGWEIDGWLCFPPDFDPDKNYPLLLYIHGGPHGAYGNTFRLEFQARAAKDRIIFFTNPRGSNGYGKQFLSACIGDWGGKDFQDIMTGVDLVSSREYVDHERMGVTGISYGGYMTNWTITHDNRFAAAITEMCVSNLLSFYGTSDVGPWFLEYEIPGSIWDDPDKLWRHSPIKYIENCHTPTLVIHGEDDYRCPIEQGEQVFMSLKRLGRETSLIRFPGCSHTFAANGDLQYRIQRFLATEGWWERYL